MNIAQQYERRFETALKKIAANLQDHIRSILESADRIDSVTARAKDPKRFAAKALKQDADGKFKYHDPMNQIEDQVGARINVLYLNDVNIVSKIIGPILRAY